MNGSNHSREMFLLLQSISGSHGAALKHSVQSIIINVIFLLFFNKFSLERKYADILSDEDMTGITQKKKKKQRMSVAEIMEKLPNKSDTGTFYSATSDKTLKEQKSATNLRANSASESSAGKKEVSKSFLEQSLGQGGNVSQGQISSDSKRMRLKPPVDSKNQSYEERLSSRRKESYLETQDRNINYIKTMKRKINPDGHFCRPDSGQHEKDEVYLYSQSRKCSYVKWVEDKKNQYIKDKNNFYTYSMMGLNLSFPLITNRNQEYLDYKANQAKWYAKKDFNRYSQPTRDKYFFPKINNEL